MDTIVIGKVLKPQGIKGEVKALPITQDSLRFKELDTVFVAGIEYDIKSVKIRDDGVYLTLDGVDDRNKAEKLRNELLYVPRSKAIKLEKDSWFITDLIGCKVTDDKGKLLGTLTDVLQNGCADVYCIDGEKLMFPALKKVLSSVDVERKEIILNSEALREVAVYEN